MSVETCSNGTADSGYQSDLPVTSPRSLKRQNIYLLQQYYSRKSSDPGFRKAVAASTDCSDLDILSMTMSAGQHDTQASDHSFSMRYRPSSTPQGTGRPHSRASGEFRASGLHFGKTDHTPNYTTCSGFNTSAETSKSGGYLRKVYTSSPSDSQQTLPASTQEAVSPIPGTNSSNNSNV